MCEESDHRQSDGPYVLFLRHKHFLTGTDDQHCIFYVPKQSGGWASQLLWTGTQSPSGADSESAEVMWLKKKALSSSIFLASLAHLRCMF